MSPDEYCRRKAAASGSSFYYGFRFLDAPRRRAIMALYAFCREVDDAVDECSDAGVAAMKLAWWRSEVAAMYDGRPTHPVTQALTAVLPEVNLPAEQLQEIIDGMAMDLRLTRYPDFRTLNLYCYRVASVVGLLAAEIFGYTDRRTQKYAHDLGLAFQLTNIIRDVGEDARRGRIYLPRDELARFGVREADILASRPTPEFTALMAFQVRRALDAYDRALGELPAVDRKTQRPGLMMAAIYRALLDEIVEDGCRVLTHRISLPPARKLWLAAKAWLHG
ncbi:MAG: presqualene diphosphate synthase HpnD [Rhodocyclaceae bacterium]|nr:presqualene diphosphate synthase HpnD [Rhodocyclaceae bacterium]